MIELGKIQKLQVVKIALPGAYLNSKENADNDKSILLPKKQIPSGTKIGDEIEVFVYRDSQDRMIATTEKPKLTLGEIASLKVVDTTKIGAFLDWGLEKDLFLPFKEQRGRVKKGNTYLVGLYIDKSKRLSATMNVSQLLTSKSPYEENDRVKGTIYSINDDIGAFVAVDNRYHGLIPKHELYGVNLIGDEIEARVISVKKDGKLDLSIRKKSYIQMDDDAEKILNKLNAKGGKLPLNDNSSPNKIRGELNMSKRAFKRASGRLLKEKKIKMTEKGIELI